MNASINLLVRRAKEAIYANEYGVKTRRLFPWPGKVNTKRPLTETGCMFVLLGPNESVSAHGHDEEETFIVIQGRALLTVDEESAEIGPGDVAYIPRNRMHSLRNLSKNHCFEMLDMYWDESGASDSALS